MASIPGATAYPAIPPLDKIGNHRGLSVHAAAPLKGFTPEKERVILLKTLTTVASVALPIEERWSIKRCRYAPDGESVGRVCIATGTHGDEMMGQLIVYLVQQRIAAHPDALRGTVDFYPMLNPLGLDIGERMVPSGTRLDMNRAFPGSPDGTPLEYMCHQVIQDMRGADFVLDLHASARSSSGSIRIRVPSPPP